MAAKTMNKPFYVVAESFKFARLFPLNQQDVPNEFKVRISSSAFSFVNIVNDMKTVILYNPLALQ